MAATGSLLRRVVGTSLLAARLVGGGRGGSGGGVGRGANCDLRAVAQLVGAVDNDAVARLETRLHLDAVAIRYPQRHLADRHRAVGVDEINECSGNAALHA